MPTCPDCGELVSSQDTVCSRCGATLQPQRPFASSGPQSIPYSSPSSGTSKVAGPGIHAAIGIASAFLALFIVPEIFGSIAVIMGGMVWKREEGNRGLAIIVAGLVCMMIGIYITSIFALGDLLYLGSG